MLDLPTFFESTKNGRYKYLDLLVWWLEKTQNDSQHGGFFIFMVIYHGRKQKIILNKSKNIDVNWNIPSDAAFYPRVTLGWSPITATSEFGSLTTYPSQKGHLS